jgi:hypothetical protein
MDARNFDRWTVALADRSNRRDALRLLAGGLLGGLLTRAAPARAVPTLQERSDRDGDGLFDDDETVDGINAEYGTDPDLFDTDGDQIGDGEEVFNGTDPLTPGGAAPGADRDGDGVYDDYELSLGTDPDRPDTDGDGLTDYEDVYYGTDPLRVDTDGDGLGDGEELFNGTDPLVPNVGPAPRSTCKIAGTRCDADAECCTGALCCFNGTSLATLCTDVAATGGVCPGDAPKSYCTISRTECGTECVDPLSDPSHCGACYNSCALGLTCNNGVCCAADGHHDNCGGYCTNLQTDMYNCGRCRNICDSAICNGGRCAPI